MLFAVKPISCMATSVFCVLQYMFDVTSLNMAEKADERASSKNEPVVCKHCVNIC